MINFSSEKRICTAMRSILAASLAFSVVPAMALSDYVAAEKENVDRYDLADGTPVQHITIKFKEGYKFRVRGDVLTAMAKEGKGEIVTEAFRSAVQDAASIRKLARRESLVLESGFGAVNSNEMEKANDQRKQRGEARANVKLADLNNYYSLISPEVTEFGKLEPLIDELNSFDSVEIAYAEPIPAPDSVNIALPGDSGYAKPTASVQGSQGYLSNSNNGVHALEGWTWKGGRGQNVAVGVVDSNVNEDHIELDHTLWSGVWYPGSSDGAHAYHGSAVMGIMVAEDDGLGVTGIVPEVPAWRFESNYYCFVYCYSDTGRALNLAAEKADPGDVIAISWGVDGPEQLSPEECPSPGNCNTVPAEWHGKVFDATQTAVANGVIVVVSASNGYVDLDHPVYDGAFDLNVKDSGAIIVGAVHPRESDGKLDFSNYGSRVTSRGWGTEVATIGYNNTSTSSTDPDEYYTAYFNGTSAAAPIVAGAVASIQSIRKGMGLSPLTPLEMRDLLVETGKAQTYDTGRIIGAMPNIDAAATQIHSQVIDCGMSYSTAQYGGFGFHGVSVSNISGQALDDWQVYLDFGDAAIPSVDWVTGASATVSGNVVVIEGISPLGIGSSTNFSIGGQYNGPTEVKVVCK